MSAWFRTMSRMVGALAVLSLTVAGCGQGSKPTTPAPAGASGDAAGQKKFVGHTLRVAMWGGGWAEWNKKAVGSWIEETTGAKVEYVLANPREHMQKMLAARGQAPPFDVVHLDATTQALAAEQGLLEKLDLAKIPNTTKIFPEAKILEGYGPGFILTQLGLAYNTEQFQKLGLPEPKSVADLWDPKLKGKVAWPGLNVVMGPAGLVAAATWQGGDMKNVAPAFPKLKELDPIVYKDSTELETKFTNGDVWAAFWIDGRTNTLAGKGYPVKFARIQVGDRVGITDVDTVDMLKGSKEQELAYMWINRQYDKDVQKIMSTSDNFSPVNREAAEEFAKDPKYKDRFITDPKDVAKLLVLDAKTVNANLPAWIDQFNRALQK